MSAVYTTVGWSPIIALERALSGGPVRPLLTPAEAGLSGLCEAWGGRRVVAAVLFAAPPPLALVPAFLALPTLWIGGHLYLQEELGASVVRLGPGVPQGTRALRALLMSWRWHSYNLLWAGPPLPGMRHLSRLPLTPTVYYLSSPYTSQPISVSEHPNSPPPQIVLHILQSSAPRESFSTLVTQFPIEFPLWHYLIGLSLKTSYPPYSGLF
ncbi:unnamed protein product [Nezara viridula]|uniref:Uncharacterized protein n=1 Tax=Nezara viridula TaxID=85310 RepID=A0A9P0H5C1_NEZVI|nr:unnamed protein product [Nezara viridula]